MKIIQVVAYYPPHLGGLENCVKEVSERLSKKDYEIEVFTSDIGCKKEILRSTKNLKIHYLKSWEFAHTPIIPSLFFKLLKIPKNSIMHIHIAQAFVPEIAHLVSKIKRIPYITHIHGEPMPTGKFGFLLPLYRKLITKKILSDSEKVICLSEDYKQFIHKKYKINENKITVIPNGISEKFFIDEKKKIIKTPNLLYVGRLSADKNVNKLIEAVSQLKNKAVLHIVGEGEKKAELKKLIVEKKTKNIILHGKKTGIELINFYKRSNIFMLASSSEGQPLTLLEAMASGTPIIASDIMGIREIVGNAGILVNPPSSENFARAIDNLIQDKKLINILSKRGIKKAKNYDWDKIIEKFENVFKNINKVNQKNKNDINNNYCQE
jgi:glycosyltransferase involved in cell wall biosynthesis